MGTKNATESNGHTDLIPPAVAKRRRGVAAPPMPDPSGEHAQSNVFELPDCNLEYFRLVITGTTECMTNKMSDKQLPALISGVVDKPKEKPAKYASEQEAAFHAGHVCLLKPGKGSPVDRFYEHLYGLKAISLKKGAVNATSILATRNKGKMMGAFFVHGPFNGLVPLLNDAPPLTEDVIESRGLRDPEELLAMAARPVIDIRTISQNATGGKGAASVSIRPKFGEWFAELYIGHYPKVAPRKQLIQLIQTAGMSVGVGSYRAERSGDQFGLYRVVSVDQMPKEWEPKRYRLAPDGKATS